MAIRSLPREFVAERVWHPKLSTPGTSAGHSPPARAIIQSNRALDHHGRVLLRIDVGGWSMEVDERARLELYQRLGTALGGEAAMTLMQHLPPGGWTNVATKGDIDVLERRFDGLERRIDRLEDRMDGFGSRMDDFHRELRTQTRVFILAMLGAMATNTSIIVAAIRFR